MTDPSPQAQAVLDAFGRHPLHGDHVAESLIHGALPAALRAAADQVVPWRPEPTEDSIGPTIDFGYAWALFSQANDVRQALIALADELERADIPSWSPH